MFNETLEGEAVERFSPNYDEIKRRQDATLARMIDAVRGSATYPNVPLIASIDRLNDLPAISHELIIERTEGKEAALLSPPYRTWRTSGYTGRSKEFHYSENDVEEMATAWAAYAYLIGIRPDASFWNFGGKEPMVSGTMLERAADTLLIKGRLFTPLACDTDFVKALKMASRQPGADVLAGTPLIFYLIGMVSRDRDYIIDVVARKVSEYYHVPKSLARVLAKAYLFRMDHPNIQRMTAAAKVGMSYSEPLSPYADMLRSMYPNIKMFDVLGSTEIPIIAGQITPESDGLAMMLQSVIPELADPEEVLMAKKDKSYAPQAVPWWEWRKGMVGELLITRPGECLPLIRYATGDVIEVLDPRRRFDVRLERTHIEFELPVIKVLSRSVDVLDYQSSDEMGNFLGNKIYTRHVNDVLLSRPDVRWWELYNIRGSPGRLVMVIFPMNEVPDRKGFEKEMRTRLIKDTDDMLNTFRVANDLDRLEVWIASPGAYDLIKAEMDRRAKEGRSLGQLKPKHIFVAGDEQEFVQALKDRFGDLSVLNELQ
jgi:phenylacetate-coenzyme A ligase PaaK-like adenylate-forming protein